MQYPIFVQNPAESHFTASVIGMPTCVAEGHTEAEALAKAEILLDEQLAKGKIFMVDRPTSDLPKKSSHAALMGYGMFKDDPTFDDFLERMAEFRQQADREFVTLDLATTPANGHSQTPHPWMKFAGGLADDPDFEEFVTEMQRERELEDQA